MLWHRATSTSSDNQLQGETQTIHKSRNKNSSYEIPWDLLMTKKAQAINSYEKFQLGLV